MPLLDHFHPPLHPGRRWESFHAAWSNCLMAGLNESVLPSGYYAETQVHIGSRVEIDVATIEDETSPRRPTNGVATARGTIAWAPPVPPLVLPMVFPDEIEVQVYGTRTGAQLVAAVELVSPGNKDRPETRRTFAAKCVGYLQTGIGLVVVDVVTERLSNLHDELMGLLSEQSDSGFATETGLYAVSYRPSRRENGDRLDCWPTALTLGEALPVVPLPLRGGPTLPLDLESAYLQACRNSRLG